MATTLPEPNFIERDPAKVEAENIALYELMVGKTLQPAQPERLFINIISYRESLLRVQIQAAAIKNLVRFSSGAMLDELGLLVGCKRLDEQPARTTLRFTLSAPLGVDYVIPAGTERGSKDGLWTFATGAALVIPAGQTIGDVLAIATVNGSGANGYLAGDINVELQPLIGIATVANISTTVGGAATEEDGHYIERIILKPDSYSTAGPAAAYCYWAKTAHQDIVDVAVLTSGPGVVDLYPLMSNGLPTAEILALVLAAVAKNRQVRPLTDNVLVHAPTEVQFQIAAAVTLYSWQTDDDATAIAAIAKLLSDYAAGLRTRLSTDLVIDQIRAEIRGYRGVYSSTITLPLADQVLADNEWLNCTNIVITIAGRVNG